jgi:hypothetical protein
VTLDTDLYAGASHLSMIEHLSGPLAAGAQEVDLPISAAGRAVVDWNSREAAVVAATRQPLDEGALRLTVVLDPDTGPRPLLPMEFAPFSEAGAFLLLHQPVVAASTGTSAPFSFELALTALGPDGTETSIAAADIGEHIQIRVIEGVLGRLILALGNEKARIRRQAREIAALRHLPRARLDALDRAGGDLGVPRFADNLAFRDGSVVTERRREPDDEYRRRLAIYKPFLLPNRHSVGEMLNGPGADSDPNRGLLSGLGQDRRLALREEDNEFAVAIHLVSVGADTQRTTFLDHVRRARLVLPRNDPPSNQAHAERFLPATRKEQAQALRTALRNAYQFTAGAGLAPMLASTLASVARCRAALGVTSPWPVLRSADAAGGSRYELGLGADLALLPVAELNALRTAHANPARPPAEAETEALLQEMTPRPANEDPEGRWLLEACGLRTVHRVDEGRVYVSHFPTFGLVLNGPSNLPAPGTISLEAHYHAPGDPGKNVVLETGLAAALSAWTAAGRPAWQRLTDGQATAQWDLARPVAEPALSVLRGALLPAVSNPAPVVERLKRVAPELLETIRLAPAQSAAILAGQAQAVDDLRLLTDLLRAQGIVAALPLVTNANQVLIAAGVVGLPEAGLNLSDRRATGFRWHVVPIRGTGATIGAIGDRTTFSAMQEGLYAVVCVAYARRGLTDPFEYEVDMPDGAVLTLLQYEFLMNLLDHTYPMGVEVNTYSIRREHVDLNGDGRAEALLPAASRTYRTFTRPRYRG